jgi:hypothetical protein
MKRLAVENEQPMIGYFVGVILAECNGLRTNTD